MTDLYDILIAFAAGVAVGVVLTSVVVACIGKD